MGQDRIEILKHLGALYLYDGDPTHPHAVLTSGLHSNGYINFSEAISYPLYFEAIVEVLSVDLGQFLRPDAVVLGAMTGGAFVGYALASVLKSRFAYAMKKEDKTFDISRFRDLLFGSNTIVLAEDVMTTGQSAIAAAKSIMDAGGSLGKLADYMVTVVDRRPPEKRGTSIRVSGAKSIEVVSYLELSFDVWEELKCPLCNKGSKALKPKDYWDEFKQVM